ncbi:MAG TPA: hypothetical protein VFH01_10300, partial [Pyrinomonadaceae bacterium]|nr:hypothetical protein [Pyrinomonadaceae bacterium]
MFLALTYVLFGLALGALLVWLALRSKISHEYDRAMAKTAPQLATVTERLAGKENELRQLQHTSERQIAEQEALRAETMRLKAALEGERRAAQERSESFKQASEELTQKFKALSRDALKDNNQSFLELAKANLEKIQETAKGDLELRRNAIDELVKPLKESLEKVDGRIVELEKARAGAYSELREQVKTLAMSHLQLQA